MERCQSGLLCNLGKVVFLCGTPSSNLGLSAIYVYFSYIYIANIYIYFILTLIMKSFKDDLMEAIALVSNIEHQLKINTLNGNEKTVFYSILLKEKENTECIISDVINISKLSRSTVFKTLKKLENLQLILSKQSTSDKRELVISVNV